MGRTPHEKIVKTPMDKTGETEAGGAEFRLETIPFTADH
jgi:hypothetical protein